MLAVLSPTPSVSLGPVDLELPVPDALPRMPEDGMTLLKAEGIEPDSAAGPGDTTSLPVLAHTGGAFATLHASGWERDDLIWAQDRAGHPVQRLWPAAPAGPRSRPHPATGRPHPRRRRRADGRLLEDQARA